MTNHLILLLLIITINILEMKLINFVVFRNFICATNITYFVFYTVKKIILFYLVSKLDDRIFSSRSVYLPPLCNVKSTIAKVADVKQCRYRCSFTNESRPADDKLAGRLIGYWKTGRNIGGGEHWRIQFNLFVLNMSCLLLTTNNRTLGYCLIETKAVIGVRQEYYSLF